jgi:hypothetical protein
MGFWGMGGRIGDVSFKHDSKIFICDIYGDLLATCIISGFEIRILLQELIQLFFIAVFCLAPCLKQCSQHHLVTNCTVRFVASQQDSKRHCKP